MFIYLIVNHETGKYYVGQHKGNNLQKYLQQKFHHAQRGVSGSSHLFNSMRKHPDSKVWSIHALRSDIQTREELNQTEKDFIKFLRATDPEFGYNICKGGEGFTGPVSQETRRKLSVSIKAGMSSTEYRQKRSLTSKEMWRRPGYRENHITKITETLSSPEKRAEKARIGKELWSDKSGKMLGANKEAWSDPKKRTERIEAIRKGHSDPQDRAKVGETSRKMWLDPEYRAKMAKRKTRKGFRKRFCKHGHDTDICGRYPSGSCKGCRRS